MQKIRNKTDLIIKCDKCGWACEQKHFKHKSNNLCIECATRKMDELIKNIQAEVDLHISQEKTAPDVFYSIKEIVLEGIGYNN